LRLDAGQVAGRGRGGVGSGSRAAGRPADQRPAERRLAWLPHHAESTQVVELAKRFAPADSFPALVVDERPGGPSPRPTRPRRPPTPGGGHHPGRHREGHRAGPGHRRPGRWWRRSGWRGGQRLGGAHPRVEELRSIAQADTGGLGVSVTGPAGYVADFAKVFSGFDATLLSVTAVIVVVILLVTCGPWCSWSRWGPTTTSSSDPGPRGEHAPPDPAGCPDRPGRHRRGGHLGRGSCWPGPWPPWAPCRWWWSPRSAWRSPSGSCWTPSWSARCWSPR